MLHNVSAQGHAAYLVFVLQQCFSSGCGAEAMAWWRPATPELIPMPFPQDEEVSEAA